MRAFVGALSVYVCIFVCVCVCLCANIHNVHVYAHVHVNTHVSAMYVVLIVSRKWCCAVPCWQVMYVMDMMHVMLHRVSILILYVMYGMCVCVMYGMHDMYGYHACNVM